MNLKVIICCAFLLHGTAVFAADKHAAMGVHEHDNETPDRILTEAGNDAFGTIQEVINKLNSDPNTDWNKVNIEALRQHLRDMNEMTLNVDLVFQNVIKGGLQVTVRPTTESADSALERVFKAHPGQLQHDTGWVMKVEKNNGQYTITTTSDDPEEADKIRGLGYIGLMAYGAHHQRHHWAMATGKAAHKMAH